MPHNVRPEQFLAALGGKYGPYALQLAIVATASTLLMGAANTAIIGCYHVFLALVRLGFLPTVPGRAQPPLQHAPPRDLHLGPGAHRRRSSSAAGKMVVLGHLYAFGLLGAFTLTSVGLDRIRWQERKLTPGFYIGLVHVGGGVARRSA